jgi:hypothetical protein
MRITSAAIERPRLSERLDEEAILGGHRGGQGSREDPCKLVLLPAGSGSASRQAARRRNASSRPAASSSLPGMRCP